MPETSTITDEMRSHIGVESEPATYEVTRLDIGRFACAIGDENPLYGDEATARSSALGSLIAPPTILRSFLPGSTPEPFPEPFAHILDAGSSYRFLQPIRLGDTITVVRSLKELFTKSGRLGEMLFKVQEIKYTNQLGQLVAVQETTTITFGEPDPNSGGTLVGTV